MATFSYTLRAAHNLAATYNGQGRHTEAEELQLEVLEARPLSCKNVMGSAESTGEALAKGAAGVAAEEEQGHIDALDAQVMVQCSTPIGTANVTPS